MMRISKLSVLSVLCMAFVTLLSAIQVDAEAVTENWTVILEYDDWAGGDFTGTRTFTGSESGSINLVDGKFTAVDRTGQSLTFEHSIVEEYNGDYTLRGGRVLYGIGIMAGAGPTGIIRLGAFVVDVPIVDGEIPAFYSSTSYSATSSDGSTFTGSGSLRGVSLTVTVYSTITFADVPPSTYTITASAGTGGSISPSSSFSKTEGSSQQFTAFPDPNYVVNQWKVDGSVVQNGGSSYTLSNIQQNHSVQVTFTYVTPSYAVTTISSPPVGGTTGGGGSKLSGSVATVTVSANSGYTFTNWTEGGNPVSTSSSYTFTVSGARTLVANFITHIPGTIEMEDYDVGGEGLSYHDSSTGNSGGQYRSDDVDILTCSEGGYAVGYTASGEWLAYGVKVLETASYTIDVRVANPQSGGQFHIEVDGQDVTGLLSVPNTGGWQAWQTITVPDIQLAAGSHELKLVMDAAAGNLNYISFNAEQISFYTLAVVGGEGDGTTYTNGQQVAITADAAPSGQMFDRWTGDTAYVADVNSPNTTVTMPAQGITVTATYKPATPNLYTLTVNNGVGSGAAYTNGQQVIIEADAVPAGKVFDHWTGATQHVADVSASSTTVTMPPANITVSATYALPIPGLIELEDYNTGGAGIAYTDTTSGNAGGQYRSDDVDILSCSEGGYTVGYAVPNEWLAYGVKVQVTGTYTIEARVACPGSGGEFHIEVDGQNISGPVSVPNTGGWQAWTTVSVDGIQLTRGSHELRLVMDAGSSSGGAGNLNYLNFSGKSENGVPLWWLGQYGLSNADDALKDGDLDGLKTWQEYIAGSDPANKASCFRASLSDRNVIDWSAVSGRVYSAWWSTNLMSGFQPLETNIPWTQGEYTDSVHSAEDCIYYKLDVRLEQ